MKAFQNPKMRVIISYAFDWVFCIILLVLFFLLDRLEPFHREFSVENTSIMYTLQDHERIPIWALVLIAIIFPVLTILLVGLGIRRSLYDVHNGFLGLMVSVLLTTMFTQVIKVTVGKHRPDFLDRCQPSWNGVPVTADIPLRLWNVDICSQVNHAILKDGMRSFPSGHASTAFAGLLYISLWMGGKMFIFDRYGYTLKAVILVVPILAAILIAISRVMDYRHSGVDVTWGSIIGIIFAVFAYFQYYPPLTSASSDVPYPPRNYSKLVRDSHGRVEESSRLENAIGIRPNDSFVDETGLSSNPSLKMNHPNGGLPLTNLNTGVGTGAAVVGATGDVTGSSSIGSFNRTGNRVQNEHLEPGLPGSTNV